MLRWGHIVAAQTDSVACRHLPATTTSVAMQVAFVPGTHYVFTAGKDRALKFWDADRWELLLSLEGHHAEVCLLAGAQGLPAVRSAFSNFYPENLGTSLPHAVVSNTATLWLPQLDLALARFHFASRGCGHALDGVAGGCCIHHFSGASCGHALP